MKNGWFREGSEYLAGDGYNRPSAPAPQGWPIALGSEGQSRGEDNIEDWISQRIRLDHSPGMIAMDLERRQPGLGRELLARIHELNQTREGRLPPGSPSPVGVWTDVSESDRNPMIASGIPEKRTQDGQGSAGFRPTGSNHFGLLSSPKSEPETIVRQVAYKPNDDKWGPANESFIERQIRSQKEKGLKKNPQVRENVYKIINGITGGQFKPDELSKMYFEVVDNIGLLEAPSFSDVEIARDGGLDLTPRQWRIVRKIIDGIPHDALGKRVRSSYDAAVKRGRIRIIK